MNNLHPDVYSKAKAIAKERAARKTEMLARLARTKIELEKTISNVNRILNEYGISNERKKNRGEEE